MQRKSKVPDERKAVQEFILDLHRRANVYTFVDTDSKARLFRSGFDFIVCANGRSIFIEAKAFVGGRDLEKLYTDFQLYTRARILAAGGIYCGLAFTPEGHFLRWYSGADQSNLAWLDFPEAAEQIFAILGIDFKVGK